MEILVAILVGGLFAASTYLLLQHSMVRMIFGMILMTTGVNLLIFTAGRLTRGNPPLIPEDQTMIVEAAANPLPQAVILTAVVINFGLLAFVVALVYRTNSTFNSIDADTLRTVDPPDE